MAEQKDPKIEKILTEILIVQEQIWETKLYMESDICQRCSEMYNSLVVLEQKLKGLKEKITDGDS